MPDFSTIKPGAYVSLNTGFGVQTDTPLDLRSVVDDLQMLKAMLDAHWLYEGQLIFNKNDKKRYEIYVNGSGELAYKFFEIEASQVQYATEADHLRHTISINGVETTLSGDTLNINRLVPLQIANYSDLDSTTNTGQYYGTDSQNNDYLLTIEAIGDDKLIRTMTTIENDRVVIKKAIATKVNDEWVWGEWTLADGSVSSAYISWLSPNVEIDAPAGMVSECWIYSIIKKVSGEPDRVSKFSANATTIHTSDGQIFTCTNPPAADINHPFVVKLHSNGVTKTATVESLAATGSNHGLVTLSESINDNTHGANSGVAASPKAVASLNSALATESHQRQSGDSALQSNINSEANARMNADAAINNTITDLKNKIRALFGYDVNNVYLATCGTAVQAGDVGLNWANQPTQLNLNDVVAVTFTVNQVTQMGQKSIRTSNGYIYEVNWGSEITANTTKFFVCTRVASGSTTSTWGKLTIGNTMPSRISSVESRVSAAETKLAKIPIGMIVMWSGSTIPTGWILCNGNNGNKVICADGVSRNVPDLRNRFIVGSGSGYNIGTTGGKKQYSATDLPAHRHIFIGDTNIRNNAQSLPDGLEVVNSSESINGWSADGTGTGCRYYSGSTIYEKDTRLGSNSENVEILPPYYALAFIMFKG